MFPNPPVIHYWFIGTGSNDWIDVLLISLFASLAGAVGGTFGSLWFEGRRRNAEQRKREILSGNLVMHTLARMHGVFGNYEKQALRSAIVPPNNAVPLWIRLGPWIQREPDLRIDVQGIGYFLDTPKSAQILYEVVLQEERYRELIAAMNEHANLILESRSILAAAGLGLTREPTDAEYIDAITINRVIQLRDRTAGIISGVYENLPAFEAAVQSLYDELVHRYGKDSIRKLGFPDLAKEIGHPLDVFKRAALDENRSRPSATAETPVGPNDKPPPVNT